MKKTKTVKKTKSIKPEYIVDITSVKQPIDAYVAFGLAKQRAGRPISDDEMQAIVDRSVRIGIDAVTATICNIPYEIYDVKNGEKLIFDEDGKVVVKKPNVFRRFWNWITRKK